MEDLAALPPEAFAAHEALLGELRETSAPPTSAEVNAYVSRLASAGLYGQARSAWINLSRGSSDLIGDGQFQHLSGAGEGSPFGWNVNPIPGTTLRRESSARLGNVAALHLTADGRPSGQVLEQMLVLAPGTYLLVIVGSELQPGSLESLEWGLTCIGGNGEVQASRREPSESSGSWRRIERQIVVPPSTCPAQRLQLSVDHYSARDLDAWLSSVEVRRLN